MANYSTAPAPRTVWILIIAGVLSVGLITLAIVLSIKGVGSGPTPTVSDASLSHDTLNDQETTWAPNYSMLASTLSTLKLPAAGNTLHNHIHLDIEINGNPVEVPAQIGLASTAESPLHTHDNSGIIHIESATPGFKPVLGNVFDVWGVSLTQTNIGGYTATGATTLTAYVNGSQYTGDPRLIPLNQHDEILLAYGTPTQLPSPIPANYTFPDGL